MDMTKERNKKGNMELISNIYEENNKYYKYVKDYKKCAVYREISLKNGSFVVFDNDDKQVCKKTTIKAVHTTINKIS